MYKSCAVVGEGVQIAGVISTKLVQRSDLMPLNSKGKKVMASMKKHYGSKKGRKVFYASRNKGTIKGVKKGY